MKPVLIRFRIWTEMDTKLLPELMELLLRKKGTVKELMELEKTSSTVLTRAGRTMGSVTL